MELSAIELIEQLQELVKKHGNLKVLRTFDTYCHEECNGAKFVKADEKNPDGNYILIK